MKEIRILIGGMGNAARPMVDLLTSERERMENVYGLHFRIVGAVDSRGGVIAPNGISSVTLSEAKNRGTLADIPGLGIQGLTALEMIEQCSADVYLDGLPPYLPTGEPGTSNIRRALERGMHVVTANKAPLALHWKELFSLAAQQGSKFAMEQRPAQDCLLWRWVNCWDVVESCWSSAGFSTRLVCTFLMRWGRDSPLIWLCRGRRQADFWSQIPPWISMDGIRP